MSSRATQSQRAPFCRKRASRQDLGEAGTFWAAAALNGWSGRTRTSHVRWNARGACVARYYDPSTGEFLSLDPAVGLTEPPYSYVGDDPLNGVDPSGLCSDWNPFCPIVTAANWVDREASNHALAAAETLDCISDIAECTNTPEGHADYQAGIENSLDQLLDASISLTGGPSLGLGTPEPYPCASPGSYQAGELFPYIVGAATPGFDEEELGVGAADLFEAAEEDLLQVLADGGGPTTQVVTNLTKAPQIGRALSVAAGDEALAAAARSGGTLYSADIPTALIRELQLQGLARISITNMNGVTGTEIRFMPGASQYIVPFFEANQ